MINYECTEKCDFCFQKGIKFPSMMKIENFKKAIEWLERLEIFKKPERRKISIMGGEPTINPRLKDMLQILKQKRFKAVIFTNFVFNKNKINLFNHDVVKGFIGTYNPKSFYRKDEYKLVEDNILELKKKGFEVKLSYNITNNNLDYNYIFDACKRHGLNTLRFSTAFPNPNYDNEFLDFEDLKKVGKTIMSFVREGVKRKIQLDLDCTIPLCILGDKKDILFFLKHVNANNILCKSALDINPDLSVYYCVPRAKDSKVDNLLSFNNLKEINEIFETQNKRERKEVYPFPECNNCKYLIRGLCQGGCLALKKKIKIVENTTKKIIIGVKTWGGIGDGLLVTPAFKALKEKYPNSEVRVFCNQNHKDILKNNPYIDFLSVSPDKSAIENVKLDKTYETNYGKLKPSLTCKKHASKIIGDILDVEVKDEKPLIFLTKKEEEKGKKFMLKYDNAFIIQITSKCSKNKEWILENWNELVRTNPEITFIQLGLKEEELVKGVVDMRGKTTIRESIALVKYAKGFVGVDSFLAHVTTAFEIPAVVLFGPSNPIIWGYKKNINIYKQLECSPCIDTLEEKKCTYDKKCMKIITIGEVQKAIQSYKNI